PRQTRQKTAKNVAAAEKTIEDLVVPVEVLATSNKDTGNPMNNTNVAQELTGDMPLSKEKVAAVLNAFLRRSEIRQMCEKSGLGPKLFNHAFLSFRRYCFEVASLPPELFIILNDLGKETHDGVHVDDLLPFFIQHARKVFPHLEYLDDLKKVSDLRLPHNWYMEARGMQRKIFFHAGPTNSGKTYQALQRFMEAETGVYCSPLKMLATEVYHKTNSAGVPCDLITGEERQFASAVADSGAHLACTVEMLNTTTPFEVAVIDEIQMLRDQTRGWAWTRALLGVNAKEVHLCGEAAAIELIRDILFPVNEEVEVLRYKRKSPLEVSNEALLSLNNVKEGDCIVVFNKSDLYSISRELEKMGKEVALIYGSLPPATKLASAQKFNDPQHPCKIMIATDAIGMGLNLSIKRIIFWTLQKPNLTEEGEREIEILSPSTALQIAGRAGRFGAGHQSGEVTTFRRSDLPILKRLLTTKVENIKKAGLYPTSEQIEMFSFFLPKATLSNLMDIFVSLCSVDEGKYFICNIDDFKYLASLIEHVPNMTLKSRYTFCLAPVNRRLPFISQQFVKFARKYASSESITWPWLKESLDWNQSVQKPKKIADLMHLEAIFDVLDLYLWLGYRFADIFCDQEEVRQKQNMLDQVIKNCVMDIAVLLREQDQNDSSSSASEEHSSSSNQKKNILNKMNVDWKQPATRKDVKSVLERSTLTNRLIHQGLLTPQMVEKLKKEWTNSQDQAKSDDTGHDRNEKSGTTKRKNRRK
uniref:ATP-dependent RNA helicase SUV3 homolog, mitochondrial n=1 Tax=Romanomermis culicivorax TaxID=13658 RepID=A0A915HX02_ROMCU